MTRTFLGLAVLALAGIAHAQVPAGDVIVLADESSGWQPEEGSVAVDPSTGGFVAAWTSARGYPGRQRQARARRYTVDGTPAGPELQVSEATSAAYSSTRVASGEGGSFLVVWTQFAPMNDDVFARAFDASGAPLGAAVRLNIRPGPAYFPSVARLASGRFVAVWWALGSTSRSDNSIWVRRLDGQGAPIGRPIQLDVPGGLVAPAVAVRADGSFLVAWSAFVAPSSGFRMQAFSAEGVAQGPPSFMATLGYGAQLRMAIARGEGYTLIWKNGNRHRARLLGSDLQPLGDEVTLALPDDDNPLQEHLVVGAEESGAFVAVWEMRDMNGGNPVITGRRFTAEAQPREGEFIVATTGGANSVGLRHDVAVDSVGNLTVNWFTISPYAVLARRYGGLLPAGIRVDAAAGPFSDGNGMLEPGETASVRTSWLNENGSTQSFGGVLSGPTPGYRITNGSADYGAVPTGTTAECTDCYSVRATVPRKPGHVDLTVTESITPDALGQHKRWELHVGQSFSDVPRTSPGYLAIETLLHKGLTAGCDAVRFCPDQAATRAQAAVLLLLAREGASYRPPACTVPAFPDVPASSPFCPFVEELARRGITAGCGGGRFCPDEAVTDAQMAVLVPRTLDRGARPAPSAAATGRPVSRRQMATLLTEAFGLQLYAP